MDLRHPATVAYLAKKQVNEDACAAELATAADEHARLARVTQRTSPAQLLAELEHQYLVVGRRLAHLRRLVDDVTRDATRGAAQ